MPLSEAPNEIGEHGERENCQGVKQVSLKGRPKSEVHDDMSGSAGNGWATRVNLGSGAHHCDQCQTGTGPNWVQSLTGGDECDYPSDENRRAEVKQSACPKIKNRKPVYWDKRRIGSWQKDFPA